MGCILRQAQDEVGKDTPATTTPLVLSLSKDDRLGPLVVHIPLILRQAQDEAEKNTPATATPLVLSLSKNERHGGCA